jgi:hypothetical protein
MPGKFRFAMPQPRQLAALRLTPFRKATVVINAFEQGVLARFSRTLKNCRSPSRRAKVLAQVIASAGSFSAGARWTPHARPRFHSAEVRDRLAALMTAELFSVHLVSPRVIYSCTKGSAMATRSNVRSVVADAQDKGREAVEAVSEVRDNVAVAIDRSLKKRPYTTLALTLSDRPFRPPWRLLEPDVVSEPTAPHAVGYRTDEQGPPWWARRKNIGSRTTMRGGCPKNPELRGAGDPASDSILLQIAQRWMLLADKEQNAPSSSESAQQQQQVQPKDNDKKE